MPTPGPGNAAFPSSTAAAASTHLFFASFQGRLTFGAPPTTVRSAITAEKWATCTAGAHAVRWDYEGSPSTPRAHSKVNGLVISPTTLLQHTGVLDVLPVHHHPDTTFCCSGDSALAQPGAGQLAHIRKTKSTNLWRCSCCSLKCRNFSVADDDASTSCSMTQQQHIATKTKP